MAAEQSIYEKVFGQYDQADPNGTVARALEVLTHEEWTGDRLAETFDQLLNTYAYQINGRMVIDTNAMTQLEFEHYQLIEEMGDVVFNRRSTISNGLTDWPYFETTFRKHGNPLPGGNALLLGAVSPQTTCAFQAFSKMVYGAERAVTIDIGRDTYTPKHTDFVQGNALRLPFRDESFNIVHVTNLLHMLEDPEGVCDGNPNVAMRHLYGEVERVLRPAGQLVMMEMAPDLEDKSSAFLQRIAWGHAEGRFKSVLQRTGFGRVAVERMLVYDTLNHLFDPKCEDVPSRPTVPAHYMVHATKTTAP